jgi:hypothetical protein
MRASGLVFMFCAPGYILGGTEGARSRFHVLRAQTRLPWYQGRRHPFSCFARNDSFSAVPRVSGPVFKFCALRLDFHGIVALLSRFHVLRARTHFRSYRVRRGPFSCFVRLDSFSTVPRATGSVFMYCATRLVFSLTRFHVFALEVVSRGTEGVRSCFQVLRSRTRFWRYGGHWVPFSCFARPDSFSAVSRASRPVFLFCVPGLLFGGTKGVGSRFQVLSARTPFRLIRGRWVPFSCFTRSD